MTVSRQPSDLSTYVKTHNRAYWQNIGNASSDSSIRRVGGGLTKPTGSSLSAGAPYGWPGFVAIKWKFIMHHKRLFFHNPFGLADKSKDPTWTDPANLGNATAMVFDQYHRAKTGGFAMPSGVAGDATGIHVSGDLDWITGEDLDSWGTVGKPAAVKGDWGDKTGNAFTDSMMLLKNQGVEVICYIGDPAQVVVGADPKVTDPDDFPLYLSLVSGELKPMLDAGVSFGFDSTRGDSDASNLVRGIETSGSHVHRFIQWLLDRGHNVYLESYPDAGPFAGKPTPAAEHFLDPRIGWTLLYSLYYESAPNEGQPNDFLGNPVRKGVTDASAKEILLLTNSSNDPGNALEHLENTNNNAAAIRFSNPEYYDVRQFDEVFTITKDADLHIESSLRRTYNGNAIVGGAKIGTLQKIQRRKDVNQDGIRLPVDVVSSGTAADNTDVLVKGPVSQDSDDLARKYIGRFKNPALLTRNLARLWYQQSSVSGV